MPASTVLRAMKSIACLESDAAWKMVVSVTGFADAGACAPNDKVSRIRPSSTMVTDRPGVPDVSSQ